MIKLRKTQQTERRISLERVIVGEVSFLRVTNPLILPTTLFLWENSNPSFFGKFRKLKPPFCDGGFQLCKGNHFLLKIETPFFVEVEMLNWRGRGDKDYPNHPLVEGKESKKAVVKKARKLVLCTVQIQQQK